MKPYPNEELERMSKHEIIRLYKRTVEQFNNAVPVIRCKDCKYRDEQSANCTRFRKDWYVQSNSFCSWAERKEE